MSSHHFDQLLLDLYRCPDETSRWHGVLDQVCRATGARSALVQVLVKGADRLQTQWIVGDSEAADRVQGRPDSALTDEQNPRLELPRRRALKPGTQILRDSDLFAPGEPSLTKLWERSATFGLGRFLSVGVPLPDEGRLALVLHRDVDNRVDFDTTEVSFAERLLPHVERTVQLAQRLEAAQRRASDLEEAANRLRSALVLCSSDARVIWANQAAREIFARRERLWLAGDRVTATSVQETAALRQRISDIALRPRRVLESSNYLLVLGRNSGEQALQVMLQPFAARQGIDMGNGAPQASALLILAEPGRPPTLPVELVETAFDLSPTESRLAAAVCRGMSLDEYASAHGVTIETARYQLKQVLAKTQTHRQLDLVRQICSSVIAQAFNPS